MPRLGLDTAAVVQAAAGLADEDGLAALTLARVADRLGIRAPSLYAHVDGAEELHRRLAALGTRELAAALTDATAGRRGRAALAAIARAYRRYGHEHPGRYAAMQRAPAGAGDDAEAAREIYELLRASLAGYGLRGAREVHAIRAVRAALHGFVSLEQVGGFGMAVSTDASFHTLVAILHRALTELGDG